MKVEVISRDAIKPSSPTPNHLRMLELSFCDQIAAPVFMPIVLFYPTDSEPEHRHINRSHHLKQSLSEALTRFYPLAGRAKDNLFIHCNDEGVHYLEARVNCQLSQAITQPNPGDLNKLLPYGLDNIGDLVLAIQVNFFECGGIAIGVCISHKIADALSMFMFVNGWASTARGDSDIVTPHFGLATLFPPRKLSGFKPSTGIFKEKIVTKRFIFSASQIASLRAKYTDNTCPDQNPRRPTRVEALSTFIWSRFVATTQAKEEPEKLNTVLHAVNLRTRMDPPLPEYYFGNVSSVAIAVPSMDSKEECYGVVNSVRDAIKRIDGEYVKKLQEGDDFLNFMKDRVDRVTKGGVVSFSFTSLCRFPLYEADFGWGKPIWVGSASLTFKNLVVFMDTKLGDGIEAWVNLKEDDMTKFECDKELLTFVSPIPDAKTSGFQLASLV